MSRAPLTPAQATAQIKSILRRGGSYRVTEHVRGDMECPRDWAHDVSDDEVHICLIEGCVTKNADYNSEHDEWVYQVEYQYDTHQIVAVTAILSSHNQLTVVTRFRRKTKYDRRKPKAPK